MLSASATFAADDIALNEASNEIAAGGDVLNIAVDTETVEADNSSSSIVTEDTFLNYFSEDGTLLDNVTSDELIFEGDFSNLGISYLTIGNSIKLTGNGTAFEGVSFAIYADDVVVDGFTVTQTNDLSAFTVYGVSNVILSNNIIDFTALEGFNSFAVYAYLVDNFNLINNTIIFNGNTNGTDINNAVRIEGDDENTVASTSITVEGNLFEIDIPSVDVGYDPDTWASTVMSEGIVFYYVDGLRFVDNRVDLKYNDFTSAYGYDSIYAVSVRSDAYSFGEIQSANVVIADNIIDVSGHACTYPVYVCADNFNVSGNIITATTENYLAHGIDVDGPSSVGVVSDNVIAVEAPDAAYGIYSYQYMGAVENISYIGNDINVTGYLAGAMELVECNPTVVNNTIVANGNYTYGIVASIRDDGVISGNEITVYGSNMGTNPTGDSLMPANSMGISVKGSALIENNGVYSTNIGLNFVEKGGSVINGNIIVVEANNPALDSYAIYAKAADDLTFTDNTIAFIGNTNGTAVNNAVRIEGDDDDSDNKIAPIKDITFEGNTFDISIPSVDVGYDPDTWASTVMSEGIVFYYVDGLRFVDNRVDLKYNDFTSAYGYDSIYAVSVRSDAYSFGEIQSANVVIADNIIDVSGHACTYPVYVCADNFNVSGNIITATTENYLAHGIDVDGPSSVGVVSDNVIAVEAPDAAYGIYSYQYMGAVENISYIGNDINVTGYLAGAMELVECNPTVVNNTIVANGNYTYGIVASIRDDGVISGNEITVYGSNMGTNPTGDSLMPANSMGISVKGSALIENNGVYSTNIGLNFVEKGGSVINGNIIVVEANNPALDSYAIYAKAADDLTFTDNTIAFIGNTNGTAVNNAVRIEGDDDDSDNKIAPIKDITFEGNTFDISIPSVDVAYDPITYEATTLSEGIVFYYVDGLRFVDNRVTVGYNDVITKYGYDSLYAVSVKSNAYVYDFDDNDEMFYPIMSKDVVIADNIITIEGPDCVYGVSVAADNFTVSGNTITVDSENYLAHGIDILAPSFNGVVDLNEIDVDAIDAYGVYSDGSWAGPVDSITYSNNTITVEGYASAGMELMEKAPSVIGNNIFAFGNYTYGIVASIYEEGEIINNQITVLGSNVGTDPTGDSLMPANSMGITVKGKVSIVDNGVYSTNIGLNFVEEGGSVIDGNTIVIEANNPALDSYAIYAKAVDDLTFTDNTVTFNGNTDGTAVNNAVRIEGDDDKVVPAKDITFEGNAFDIYIPSVDVVYDPDTYEATVMSEGIVFYYVDGVEFVDNRVDLRYNNFTTAYGYDTIYAIAVRSDAYSGGEIQSANIFIDNNTINAAGHNYIYAITVTANDFTISDNTINATADSHYANGINVEGPSTTGNVIGNVISVEAPDSAYGTYSFQYMGKITGINYINNTIDANAYLACAMEVVEADVYVVDSTIKAMGNYTYGIVASIRNTEGVISGNDISVYGSNVGTVPTGDSLTPRNSMAISVKGTSLIENNSIYSTGLGINLVETGEITVNNNNISVASNGDVVNNAAIVVKDIDEITITNNFVVTDTEYTVDIGNVTGTVHDNYLYSYTPLTGDESVLSTGDATVYNNTPIMTVITVETTIIDNTNDYVTAILEGYDGNGIGQAEVEIEINGESFTNTTDDNGQVKFDCKDLAPGTYPATISYYGAADYMPSNATADVVVKAGTVVSAVYDDSAKELVATLINNATGQPIKSGTVRFNIDGVKYTVKSDAKGQAKLSTADLALGNYTATVSYNGNAKYTRSTTTVDMVVKLNAVILVEDLFVEYGGDAEVVATLMDVDTVQPIAGADITFNINGESYNATTDDNGQATVTVSGLAPGTYTAAVSCEGDEFYNPSSEEFSIVVNKMSTSISAIFDDESNEFIATLINTETGAGIRGATVVMYLNGAKTNVKTDKNGQAIFAVDDADITEYHAAFSYGGNSKYLKSTTSINAVENKTTTTLSTVYDKETGEIVATLTNTATGAFIKGASVAIKVDGVKTTIKTDKNGQAKLSIVDLDANTYSVDTSYAGNTKYAKSVTSITVVKFDSVGDL